ncbi:type II toxin-antitoxin system HipA family toxin [Pluralibacter gergoviae]|uniref:type II toxin-antitoxin system HipA family toxin n=1 Tax=Pluralibacter gergoviae TaxID=61647 RepID=UPI000651739E|nr:HipA domain-containing protein [Pluralibacter gergoviae]ELN2734904.1 HipA domain-containing protein [Pluralibacter gergoviae]KMK32398.1 toxin HipA [Pluralibacter gergoviae]
MATIGVYADWDGLRGPRRIGFLHGRRTRARELFEFEYDPQALNDPALNFLPLDPEIAMFTGAQYPAQPRDKFGVFADSCPDRWGRMLMKRRLERDIRAGALPPGTQLYESDYLLGVHDLYRVGALRYRLEDRGAFLDNRTDAAAPPFTELPALERASLALENDVDNSALMGQQWLRMLIAPGGSLGGARPKASVVDDSGQLYIAKFPSARDDYDVGGWEMVVNALAVGCGLNVAPAQARKFASPYHTFLVRRFDRTPSGQRFHFASAMTLTRHQDRDDAATGVSYLELADVLIRHGAQTQADLRELWSRIVFNLLVSNADDHLRNHGFILVPGRGWRLSEAYDINPVARADGLKLNITQADNALDLELAREVAGYFRLVLAEADGIIADFRAIVSQWQTIAHHLALPAREQEAMSQAFTLAGG